MIIKHATGQYFIIDGDDVYVSLSEKLEVNKHVLFLKGGKPALEEFLKKQPDDFVHLLTFLDHLSRTPVHKAWKQKSSLEYKAELNDALIPFTRLLFKLGYYTGYDCENNNLTESFKKAKKDAFEKKHTFTFQHPKGRYDISVELESISPKRGKYGSYVPRIIFVINGIESKYGFNIDYHQHNIFDDILVKYLWMRMDEIEPREAEIVFM